MSGERGDLDPPLPAEHAKAAQHGGENDRLRGELADARARLDALTAANRDYRTVNEELQAANEALLHAREELQLANAELRTVNGDLAEQLTALGGLHRETEALLGATGIAVLALDRGARLRFWTPRVAELFPVQEADRDRPVVELGARIPYPELADDAARALATAMPVARRIRARGGLACSVRVLAHAQSDGFAPGTVAIFLELN